MQGVRTAFPKPNMGARKVLEEMLPDSVTSMQNGVASEKEKGKEGTEEQQLPEIWAYLGILVQVCNDMNERDNVCLGGLLTQTGLSL